MDSFDVILAPNILTDRDGYRHLSEIYGKVMSQENHNVRIVFDQCSEFEANLTAVLGAILTDLKERGYKIWLTLPISRKVRRDLSRCKFLKAFQTPSNSLERENYLDYRAFSTDDSELFKCYVEEQLMQKQKFPAHSEMAGKLIQESIMEIFVNAIEHGKCDQVFCCGEFIGNTVPPVLNMTIVDRGHTILRTVNDFRRRKSLKDIDACRTIRWALEEGHTTKNFPGGLGLSRLKSFITANKGCMQIVSDSGLVEMREGNLTDSDIVTPFEGTIVTMKFNFDDRSYFIAKEELPNFDNLL